MEIKDVYDLIPWDVLRRWAASVHFNDTIINPNFPKYEGWSEKAVYADYLMDYADEGFTFENVAYEKAEHLREQDIPDEDFLEVYKLFFDSSIEEDDPPDSPERKAWEKRLEEMGQYFKGKYGAEIR